MGTAQELLTFDPANTDYVTKVRRVRVHGNRLYISYRNGKTAVSSWDCMTAQQRVRFPHTGYVEHMCLQGDRLFTIQDVNLIVQAFHTETGEKLMEYCSSTKPGFLIDKPEIPAGRVCSTLSGIFVQDDWLFVGSTDGYVRMYSVETGGMVSQMFPVGGGAVNSLWVHGRYLFAGCTAGIKMWDWETYPRYMSDIDVDSVLHSRQYGLSHIGASEDHIVIGWLDIAPGMIMWRPSEQLCA